MRTGLSILLIFALAGIIFAADTQNEYSPARTETHVRLMMANPYVSPTPSCSSTLALPSYAGDPIANYVIGHTPGNTTVPVTDVTYAPAHNIYAYKISDPNATGPKVNIVITAGNHNKEASGSWGLQGMEDFFASNEEAAINLRKIANIYVYPLCNPDGRYTRSARANPEVDARIAAGTLPPYTLSDHNRLWNLDGWGLSTIDAVVGAMKADTGGQAEYFFDYHSGNQDGASFYYTVPSLYDCPFGEEFAALNPTVPGESRPVGASINLRPGDYRMTRVWAMRPAPEGLNSRFGYTSENTGVGTTIQRMALGRLYGLAIYNSITKYTTPTEGILSKQFYSDNVSTYKFIDSTWSHNIGGGDNRILLVALAEEDTSDLKTISENWLTNNLVLREGQLLGQWKFDDEAGSTTAADSSGNGHDGTLVGNAAVVDDAERGKVLWLDGNGDYVNLGNGAWTNPGDHLTIAAWIKVDVFDVAYQTVIAKGLYTYRLGRGGGDTMQMYMDYNASHGYKAATGTTNINDDQWHHVVTTYDGSAMKIYIDSFQEDSAALSTLHTDTKSLMIGRNSDSTGRDWQGWIDDVRIYNYALLPDEILQIYQGREIAPPGQTFICQGIPAGDMNKDCIVNYLDFAMMASTWLKEPKVVSVTYNNVEMIPVPNSSVVEGFVNKVGSRFYYLLEEDLPQPGYYTVAVTYSGSVLQRLGGSISRSGVVQQAPVCLAINSNSEQNAISTNVTTTNNNAWIVDTVACDASGSFTTTSNGMTEWWDISGANGGSTMAGSCKTQSQAGPTTMSWSYNSGANMMVHSIIECKLQD